MCLFVGDDRDLVVTADIAPSDKSSLNHPLECETIGVTLDTVDKHPDHGWA
jgi:hypothetical protein